MESGRKVPIKKSLMSLKNRVKVFSLKFLALSLQSLILFWQNSLYFVLFNQFLAYHAKKKEKQVRSLIAEIVQLRKIKPKNLELGRLHHKNERIDSISGKVQHFDQLLG